MIRYRKPWRLFFSIFKEAFPFIALSFFILTTLVFVQQVGKYSSIILSFQTSTQITLRFLLSLIPGIVIITLPVSLLLGTVIACSRLSSDNELIAAQSLGVSKLSLALPFIAFGLLGTLLTFYLSGYVAPRALKQLKTLRAGILLQEATTQIRPHAFITSFPNVLLFVQDVDTRTGEWVGVFILQQDQERKVSRLLTSERGRLMITPAPQLALEAELHRGLSLENNLDAKSSSSIPVSQAAANFDKLSIKLTKKEGGENDTTDSTGGVAEMTIKEVARFARTAKSDKDRIRAKVEWHKRIAFSFACLTLTCVSFIIALRGKRFSTRPRTVVAILFVAMGFYLLLIAGQNSASSGSIPAWLGVWLSNFLLGLFIVKSFIAGKRYISLPSFQEILKFICRPFTQLAEEFRKWANRDSDRVFDPKRSAPYSFSPVNLINYLIISEIAKYYMLALLSLVVTSVIFTLFDLIPALARSGSRLSYAFVYLAYLAPQLAYYVSPFAMLVAILTGCSVLSRSNQLVILAGAGQGKGRIIMAIMIAAFSLNLGLWLFSDYILPHTTREQDVRYHRIKNRQLEQTTIAFGKKWVYGKNNIVYSYQRIDADNSLINTSVYHLSPQKGVIEKATHFAKATPATVYSWRATDGWIDTIKPDLTIERSLLGAGNQTIQIDDGAGLFKRTVNESAKMSSGDLRDYIDQLDGIGIATTELQLDLKKRVAFPFSCLTLALFAIPFATTRQSRKSSALVSVALGIGISLTFWLLMTIFEAAGKQASLPATLSVWGPQILFLALGLFLNFKHRLH